MGIIYRRMEGADAPALRAIQKKLFPDHRFDYSSHAGDSRAPGFVAVSDDAVIGFVSALTVGKDPGGDDFWQHVRPYIRFVGVEPDLQRRGVGKELMARMCDYLRQQCLASWIYLESDRDQAAFYEKCGFNEMSETDLEAIAGKKVRSRVPFRKECTCPVRFADVL